MIDVEFWCFSFPRKMDGVKLDFVKNCLAAKISATIIFHCSLFQTIREIIFNKKNRYSVLRIFIRQTRLLARVGKYK